MIFTGAFTDLSPQSAAALLSCFVFQEKSPSGKLSDELSGHLRALQNIAKRIAKVSNEAKVAVDEEKYIESFCPGLMEVVHKWCTGSSFKHILETTEIFEGIYLTYFWASLSNHRNYREYNPMYAPP